MPTQAAVAIFQKIPCTIVLYIDRMYKKSPQIFITFPDTYTCPYVV